jgi:hypothetical protein
MDSSLQSANLTTDELDTSLGAHQNHDEAVEEEEHHVHLPNPSLWPLLLSVAILTEMAGLLFIPANPWLSIIAAPFILLGIMGWALEDPMAPVKAKLVVVQRPTPLASPFEIGQDVIDKDQILIGKVKARFNNYILVERGGLFIKTYYVPQSFARSSIKNNLVLLSLSEDELVARGFNSVPEDLYDETPEYGVPDVSGGVAQFARGPLSPAETGHYNYGSNSPGINTDASGSYHLEEVSPRPQKYVGERRRVYASSRSLPDK